MIDPVEREEVPPLVVFRADASVSLGGGHVMRCLSLAAAMSEAGWRCLFIVNTEAAQVVPILSDSQYRVLCVDEGDSRSVTAMQRVWPQGCALLVVDHYHWGVLQETACRGWTKSILVIDDLANRPHDCDTLLDLALGRTDGDYARYVPPPCRLLFGPRYALLRPQFRQHEASVLAHRQCPLETVRILVSLGATCPAEVLNGVVEAVQGVPIPHELLIVVGRSGGGIVERPGVRPIAFATNMAELMLQADVAVGAAGGTAWERCAMGLPSVLLVLAENQRHQARILEEYGVALPGGGAEPIAVERIQEGILAIVNSTPFRLQMIERGLALCDGHGAERVATIVSELRRVDA